MSTEAPTEIQVTEEHRNDPLAVQLGEKWKAELEKVQVAKQGVSTVPKTEKKGKPAESAEPTQTGKVAATTEKPATEAPAKPASALDAALETEPKNEEAQAEETDPLADLDEKKPDWAKAREKIKRLDGEAKKYRAEAEAAKKPDPKASEQLQTVQRERDELKAKLDEAKDAIVAVNIELDPEHRREFIDGRKTLVRKAAEKLKNYGGNPEAMVAALSYPEGKMRDDAISAAMGELESVPQGKIMGIIAEIEKLDERRSEIMSDPQQSWEKLTQKQQANQQKQIEQTERFKSETVERLLQKYSVDPSAEGGEEWNTAIKTAGEKALALHGNGATLDQTLETALKGEDYDRIKGILRTTRGELKALQSELAKYEDGQPAIRGNRKAPAKKETTDPGATYYAALAKAQGSGAEEDD